MDARIESIISQIAGLHWFYGGVVMAKLSKESQISKLEKTAATNERIAKRKWAIAKNDPSKGYLFSDAKGNFDKAKMLKDKAKELKKK